MSQEYFITYTETVRPEACEKTNTSLVGDEEFQKVYKSQKGKECFKSSCMDKGCTNRAGHPDCNWDWCSYHPYECINEACPEAKRVIHSRCSIGRLIPEWKETFESTTDIKDSTCFALSSLAEIGLEHPAQRSKHKELIGDYVRNLKEKIFTPDYIKQMVAYQREADKVRENTPWPECLRASEYTIFRRFYVTLCECDPDYFSLAHQYYRSTTVISNLSGYEWETFLEASGYKWYFEAYPEPTPDNTPFLLVRNARVKRPPLEMLAIKKEITQKGQLDHLHSIADAVRSLRDNKLVDWGNAESVTTPEPATTPSPVAHESEPITIEPFHFSAADSRGRGPGTEPTEIVGENVRFDNAHGGLKDIVEDDWNTPSVDAVHVREGQDKTYEVLVSNNEVAVSTNEAVVDIGKTLKEIASHITQEKIQKDETATQDTVKKSPKEILMENRYQLACEGKGWAEIVDIEFPGLGGKQRTSERNAIQRAVERYAKRNGKPMPWRKEDTSPKEKTHTPK